MNPTGVHIASRIAASLLGSYVFVWGCWALGTVLGVAFGMPYGDAYALCSLLGFVLYVACFCWAFAAPSQVRVWGVLGGGGLALTAAAWWLAQTLNQAG